MACSLIMELQFLWMCPECKRDEMTSRFLWILRQSNRKQCSVSTVGKIRNLTDGGMIDWKHSKQGEGEQPSSANPQWGAGSILIWGTWWFGFQKWLPPSSDGNLFFFLFFSKLGLCIITEAWWINLGCQNKICIYLLPCSRVWTGMEKSLCEMLCKLYSVRVAASKHASSVTFLPQPELLWGRWWRDLSWKKTMAWIIYSAGFTWSEENRNVHLRLSCSKNAAWVR